MPVYINHPEKFTIIKKQLGRNQLFFLVIVVAAVVAMGLFSGSRNTATPYVLAVLIILMVFMLMRVFGQVTAQYERKYLAYRLTVTDDYLQTSGEGTLGTTVYFDEIVQINESTNGDLLVKGGKLPYVFISAQLIGYDDVKRLLLTKHEIGGTSLFQKYGILLVAITLACMACVYISNNKIVVAISGLFLLAAMGSSAYVTQTSPLVDERTRKASRVVWIVMIAAIAILYQKLFGNNLQVK